MTRLHFTAPLSQNWRQCSGSLWTTTWKHARNMERSREEAGAGYNSAATQLASVKSLAKVKQMHYNIIQKEGDIDGS